MPIGCYSLVPYVAHHLFTHRPKSVLDLGIGFGLYGAVVREYLDGGVRPWSSRLVGVEAWAGYRNPAWELYDCVIEDSIQNFLRTQPGRFDCALLTDVIEHFERDEGLHVMDCTRTLINPGGWLLVGTPAVFMEQDATYGNEYERHRSLWRPEDFADLGFQVLLDGRPDSFGNQMVLAAWQNAGRL